MATSMSTVSVVTISVMFGNFGSGPLAEAVGRRWAIALAGCLQLAAFATLFFAKTFQVVLLSRGMTGVAFGLTSPTVYMIISELATVRYPMGGQALLWLPKNRQVNECLVTRM